MTVTVDAGADARVDHDSPRALLEAVRDLRASSAAAERRILIAATEWADAHPALDPYDGSKEEWDCPDVPDVLWSAVPEFAAALGKTTAAGSQFINEALEARHRLPLCWAELKAGRVEAWRLRRIAARTGSEPADVVAEIDAHMAPVVGRIGLIKLDKLIDETMMRLHPDDWEARQQAELDRRCVKLFDQITHHGVAHMEIRGDLGDLFDFDTAVSIIAVRLGERGDTDPLDVRRAKAVGILADPHAALALLAPTTAEATPSKAPTKPTRELALHVHLSEAAITGAGGVETVGRLERGDQPITVAMIRRWCGRSDTHVKVYPVVDLNDHEGVGQYELPDRLKKRIEQATHTCVFPWCTRPARRCDKDHRIPYDQGGASCDCNCAPLCRRHHRLKTHTAWRHDLLEVGSYLWTSPFGNQYLRDNTGTIDVSPPHAPPLQERPPDGGCFYDSA